MGKYLVTTDRLFLNDSVSVGRGTFNSKDVPVDEEIIKEACEKYPKDIKELESTDVARSSRIEKGGKALPNDNPVAQNSGDPEKDEEPQAGDPDPNDGEGDETPNDPEGTPDGDPKDPEGDEDPQDPEADKDPADKPNNGEDNGHPKKEEDITGNEIKAFLNQKNVKFDKKANKGALYALYLEACNKK